MDAVSPPEGTQSRRVQEPSTRFTIVSFLIGGPLLYFPIFLIEQEGLGALTVIIAPIIGLMIWVQMLFSVSMWFVSWIPTTISAIICAYFMRRLAARRIFSPKNTFTGYLTGATLSAVVSGCVYRASDRVGERLFSSLHGFSDALGRDPERLGQANAVRWLFGDDALAVTIAGGILGLWLARAALRSKPL